MAASRTRLSHIVKTLSKRGAVNSVTIPRVKSGKGRMVWIRRSGDLRIDSTWQEGKTSTIFGVLDELDNLENRPGVYCGFDPTANSLHLGHLSLLYTMFRLTQHGFPVTALIGGATSRLGDPVGKSTSRNIQSEKIQTQYAASLEMQIQSLFNRFSRTYPQSQGKFSIVNNSGWYENMTVEEYITEIAANFKLVNMMSRSVIRHVKLHPPNFDRINVSVKQRLEAMSGDMPFPEFCYMTFQAYDWYRLHTKHNCRIQLGGFDQIGNIEDGFSYIWMRPGSTRPDLAGITIPLLKTSDGQKLGKSRNNKTIWLDTTQTPLDKTKEYLKSLHDLDVRGLALSILDTPLTEITEMSKMKVVDVLMHELEVILSTS